MESGYMSIASLEKQIESIVSSPEFETLRTEKNLALEHLDFLADKYEEARSQNAPSMVKRLIGNHQLRETTTFGRAVHEFNLLQNKVADLVEQRENLLTERDKESGNHIEYVSDTLGNAHRTASFPSGSKEWLEQRQQGIGGSDVGKILGLTGYREDRHEVLISKVAPITDKEVEAQNVEGTAAARGNSWENAILREFAERHPGLVVGHCKDSWRSNTFDYQTANVDGLLKHVGDKNWNGILEIKTSTRPNDWKNGIPLSYLAQGLNYLDCFHFDFGYVAVMIDSCEYREYYFDAWAKLPIVVKGKTHLMTFSEARYLLEEFNNEVQEARDKVAQGHSIEEATAKNTRATHRGTPRSVTPTRIAHLQAFRQDKQGAELKSDDTEELMNLYRSVDPSTWKKNILALDLETSRLSPRKGFIIELGATERNSQGEEVDRIDTLFDIPHDLKESHGTGAVAVHGITLDDIEGKQLFADDTERIMEKLAGRVMLAHNASYEIQWLSQHLPGFIEAEIEVIDTMHLATMFMPELPDSRLKTMCDALGVPYTNGHRAFHDADVTADVFFALLNQRILN